MKICGLRERSDVEVAIESGADLLGFIFAPTSPRYVGNPDFEPDWLHSCAAVTTVAVHGILTHEPPASFGTVQAVDWRIAPDRPRIVVWRMGGNDPAPQLSGEDILLLDAFHEGAYGGTGKLVDWERAAELVSSSPHRVILAGGLNPDNVAKAVQIVRPYGVDVASGVESAPGKKDHTKIRDFILAAKGA